MADSTFKALKEYSTFNRLIFTDFLSFLIWDLGTYHESQEVHSPLLTNKNILSEQNTTICSLALISLCPDKVDLW